MLGLALVRNPQAVSRVPPISPASPAEYPWSAARAPERPAERPVHLRSACPQSSRSCPGSAQQSRRAFRECPPAKVLRVSAECHAILQRIPQKVLPPSTRTESRRSPGPSIPGVAPKILQDPRRRVSLEPSTIPQRVLRQKVATKYTKFPDCAVS